MNKKSISLNVKDIWALDNILSMTPPKNLLELIQENTRNNGDNVVYTHRVRIEYRNEGIGRSLSLELGKIVIKEWVEDIVPFEEGVISVNRRMKDVEYAFLVNYVEYPSSVFSSALEVLYMFPELRIAMREDMEDRLSYEFFENTKDILSDAGHVIFGELKRCFSVGCKPYVKFNNYTEDWYVVIPEIDGSSLEYKLSDLKRITENPKYRNGNVIEELTQYYFGFNSFYEAFTFALENQC